MVGLCILRSTAHLVRLKSIVNPVSVIGDLLQAAAMPTATCVRKMKYDWACRHASILPFFFNPRRGAASSQNPLSAPSLALILWALPGVTSAMPTGSTLKVDEGTSTEFLLVLLFCLLCALGVLVAGHIIAKRTGEMATYGTFIGIESMAWWLIATDPNNSILFLFTYGP